MFHVDSQNHALAEVGDSLKQLDHLLLEQEVFTGDLAPRSIVAADLHLLYDFGSWVEDGFATPDDEVLDTTEVEPSHKLHKAAVRIGKG